jgi:serine protease Do
LNPKLRACFLIVAAVLAAALAAGCSEASGNRQNNLAQVPAQASPQIIPGDEPVAKVAAEVSPSVVQVNVRAIQTTPFGNQREEGIGSGVIYRKDGYIITNNHVIQDAKEVNVAFADGTTERGQVVASDPRTDIAVVKVDRGDLPAAKFDTNQNLVVGQLAVAIGSPSGFESTVTSGVISGLGREVPPQLTGRFEPSLVDLIQTDAAISPGNSGGALVDRDGEVIGINVAYLPPQQTGAENIGFAIPSDTAVSVANQLINTGKVSSAYLGVFTTDLTAEDAQRFGLSVDSGALVERVEPGSAAVNAGVTRGDIIVALNDTPIENSGDLIGALRDYQPGDKVQLTVVRGGNKQTLDVTLGERP